MCNILADLSIFKIFVEIYDNSFVSMAALLLTTAIIYLPSFNL